MTVISENESGSLVRAHIVVAHCYAQELPTRCHLEARWEPQICSIAAQVFGIRRYAADPSSTDVLFYAMTAAQVPVNAPLPARALHIWAEVYGEGWTEIERGMDDVSSEEFDPSPTVLNEVPPLWSEYMRMRGRGEIADLLRVATTREHLSYGSGVFLRMRAACRLAAEAPSAVSRPTCRSMRRFGSAKWPRRSRGCAREHRDQAKAGLLIELRAL